MKKLILSAMAFAAMMCATAQNPFTPVEAPEGSKTILGRIPSKLTYNNAAYCWYKAAGTYNPNTGYDFDSIFICDKNLQVQKRFCRKYGQDSIYDLWDRVHYKYITPINIRQIEELDDAYGNTQFTQTLFNDDSKFEYMLPVIENKFIIRLDIYNEDGNVVNSISIEEGYSYDGQAIKYFQLEDKCYLSFRIFPKRMQDIGEDDVKYVYYRIDRQTQSIARAENVPFNVFPTVAERGSDITVQLEEGTSAREIVVVDAMGREVKSVPVAQGQREVKINTAGLGAGMGFISDRKNGAVKIIVR